MRWRTLVSGTLYIFIDGLTNNGAGSDESSLKTSNGNGSGRPEALQALSTRTPSTTKANESSRRMFSRSRTHKPSTGGNATFLTECSFGVAHDRLVEVITDVQPFLPHWEELSSIDLSGKMLESVARLKEFLPRLETLKLWVVPFRSRCRNFDH